MPREPEQAARLKAEGNTKFQAGDYAGAEGYYSKAIIADDTNATLYTNRAMARLKLRLWDSVITDCQACLKLNDQSMKAYYYLAQAYAELHDPEEATRCALKAHKLCVVTKDRSLAQVTMQVLKCKKQRWEAAERRRIRQEAPELEAEALRLMEQERDFQLAAIPDDDVGRKTRTMDSWNGKLARLRETFDRAAKPEHRERVVPLWAIDEISFNVMVDPVMTRTGKSYERASILEHLRRSPTDPLTREPLQPWELRPNLALREACEEFLNKNGWAADY